jgi:peptidylprolyl isomerase
MAGNNFLIILIVLIVLISGYMMVKDNGSKSANEGSGVFGKKVLLDTTMGKITIELREDMPITAGNFVSLVEKGTYDGVIFHRIIDGFMIQGGDPTGTGMGDPSIPNIQDEFIGENRNDRGTISMANAGPNTGSSQFFINLVNNNFLDSKHPVFGKVVDGMDVVEAMGKVATGAGDKPVKEVKILKASVIS